MKTSDKAIIEKYKELVKYMDAEPSKRWYGREAELKAEIASLEAQDKEPSDSDIEREFERTHPGKDEYEKMIAVNLAKAVRDGKIYIAPKG